MKFASEIKFPVLNNTRGTNVEKQRNILAGNEDKTTGKVEGVRSSIYYPWSDTFVKQYKHTMQHFSAIFLIHSSLLPANNVQVKEEFSSCTTKEREKKKKKERGDV